MTTIRAFFPQIRAVFFPVFEKGQGRTPPVLIPSSYAPIMYGKRIIQSPRSSENLQFFCGCYCRKTGKRYIEACMFCLLPTMPMTLHRKPRTFNCLGRIVTPKNG